jgi:CheY-like chemotaxis protein
MDEIIPRYKYNCAMIIEDNIVDIYIAEHYLKINYFAKNVILKESPGDALDYFINFSQTPEELPRIIFLDIRLPEMDGFEFLAEYEKLPRFITEYCSIVMLSSSNDPNDLERIKLNPRIKAFISKPLNKKSLLSL